MLSWLQSRRCFLPEQILLESEKPFYIYAVLTFGHVAYALAHGMDTATFGEEIFLSCPDPGKPYGDERVVFRVEVVRGSK